MGHVTLEDGKAGDNEFIIKMGLSTIDRGFISDSKTDDRFIIGRGNVIADVGARSVVTVSYSRDFCARLFEFGISRVGFRGDVVGFIALVGW